MQYFNGILNVNLCICIEFFYIGKYSLFHAYLLYTAQYTNIVNRISVNNLFDIVTESLKFVIHYRKKLKENQYTLKMFYYEYVLLWEIRNVKVC
jgi:hypothetical protein